MANTKLPRVLQNIFGENAMQGNKIAQFGSVIAGNPLWTGDIEKIQALQQWTNGWVGATISDKRFPTSEETTGINKVITQQLAYILQSGVPEWINNEVYFENCFCSREGTIYKCLKDNNINNDPLTDSGQNWQAYRGANIDADLEIIMPYVERGIIGSSLNLQNKTLASGSDPYINNGVSVGEDIIGFSNEGWLMLSKLFPTDIQHQVKFTFYTNTPTLTQTIFGNSIENSIGIRDGVLALIFDGIEYKGTTELDAGQRYIVQLNHTTDGYILQLATEATSPQYHNEIDVPIHFNVWSNKSMYIGLAGNNPDTYLRGGVKTDLSITTGSTSTAYYNMTTKTSSNIQYISIGGSIVAWCPNGRNIADKTLSNDVNSFNGNNNTILTQQDKDLYFMAPNSQVFMGKTYDGTETPSGATVGDVWYNSETNIQQVLSTINPNLFNRGCIIDAGSITGFADNKYVELGGVFNLNDNWNIELDCTIGSSILNGFISGGKAFQLWSGKAIKHIAYGVQKESYANINDTIATVGNTQIDTNGNATQFAANSAGCVQITPTDQYTGGLWNNIWCITPNSLLDNVTLVGKTDEDFNGYLLKTNALGQLFLSVTFNGSTWGVNSASSSTGVLKASIKTYIKVEFTGNRYIVSTSTDKQDWNIVITANNSLTMQAANPVVLGGGGTVAFDGIFHLRECEIFAINSIIWTGNLVTSGYVRDSGSDNTFVPVQTQVYEDSNFTVELAKATGNDFKYVVKNNQEIYDDTVGRVGLELYREDVQKVFKQVQTSTSYQVAYAGATGYVAIEGLIGTFVPTGENIYSTPQLQSVIDIANGSNYIFTGVEEPLYDYTYGYAKVRGEEGEFLTVGTLVYSDTDATNTLSSATGSDYQYLDEFAPSQLAFLQVPLGDVSTNKHISISFNGSQYQLSCGDEEDTYSSIEEIHKEAIIILGESLPRNDAKRILTSGSINLNTSTFSFWKWNGINNPTNQWTKFIGIRFGATKGTTGQIEWPSVFNKPTSIPIKQIDGGGITALKIENVVVTNDINTLRTNPNIPNNTLILGYGGYV